MLPNQVQLGLPVGVLAGIEGGLHKQGKEDGRGCESIGAKGEEGVGREATGIMTTVKIEQTYV